jgi:hypothetical protein
MDLFWTRVRSLSGTCCGCSKLRVVSLSPSLEEMDMGCFKGSALELLDLSGTRVRKLVGGPAEVVVEAAGGVGAGNVASRQ